MEKEKGKSPSESAVIMTEVVFPNDTNPLGILRGGRMMDWMDIASAVCAQNHTGMIAVTASVDCVSFQKPVRLGDIITIKAKPTRAFNTSLEIYVEVWARKTGSEPFLSNQAFYTFVALNKEAKPASVFPVIPTSEEEIQVFNEALDRYNSRKSRRNKPSINCH